MDSLQPPTKPPRGVKNSKETSGLLMTVIRTLSTSDSNEQRDQERTKLEREYKISNQQLEQLVSVHLDDLTLVMNLFGRLSSLISHSRQKVHTAKENLLACKKLLSCRREELKKLWLESVEYKHTLELLHEIEQIKEVPSQLINCMQRKDYLKATRLLMLAINTSTSTLKDVAALHELKSELLVKKQELYAKVLEEIKEQIYVNLTQEIIMLKRQGSSRDTDQHTPSAINRSKRKILPKRTFYQSQNFLTVPNSSIKEKTQKSESVEYADDFEYVIENLIECITLLDKTPECLEELKQSTQRELTNLTMRTTKELSSSDSPNVFLEFFQILTEQFKKVIDAHKLIVECFKKKCKKNSVYDLPDVWLKMQLVIQQLLSDYLDAKKIEQVTTENSDSVVGEQYDINSFFTRRKQQRLVKGSLFKFDNSTQNNTFSKTNLKFFDEEFGHKEKFFLCKPSAASFTQIIVPLSRFSEEIEISINGSGERSKLYVYLMELAGKVFPGKRFEDIVGNVIVNGMENHSAVMSKEAISTDVQQNNVKCD